MGTLHSIPSYVDTHVVSYSCERRALGRLLVVCRAMTERLEASEEYWAAVYVVAFPTVPAGVRHGMGLAEYRGAVQAWGRVPHHECFTACVGCGNADASMEQERYWCLHCAGDVFLCGRCYLRHPPTHLVALTKEGRRPRHGLFALPRMTCTTCGMKDLTLCWHDASSTEYPPTLYCECCVGPRESLLRVHAEPSAMYSAEQKGNNPRFARCDVSDSKCFKKCIGINWKSMDEWDYDCCENCLQSGAVWKNPVHQGLIRMYDSSFSAWKYAKTH